MAGKAQAIPEVGPLYASFRRIAGSGGAAGRPAAAPPEQESRTPAPQTPAFAVPETRTVEGGPGRALKSR